MNLNHSRITSILITKHVDVYDRKINSLEDFDEKQYRMLKKLTQNDLTSYFPTPPQQKLPSPKIKFHERKMTRNEYAGPKRFDQEAKRRKSLQSLKFRSRPSTESLSSSDQVSTHIRSPAVKFHVKEKESRSPSPSRPVTPSKSEPDLSALLGEREGEGGKNGTDQKKSASLSSKKQRKQTSRHKHKHKKT